MVDVGGPSPFGQCYPWPGHLVLEVDWASHGKWTYRHNSTMVSALVPDSLLLLWGPVLTSLTDGLWYGSQCQINPFFFFFLKQSSTTETNQDRGASYCCLLLFDCSWKLRICCSLRMPGSIRSSRLRPESQPQAVVCCCLKSPFQRPLYSGKDRSVASLQDELVWGSSVI